MRAGLVLGVVLSGAVCGLSACAPPRDRSYFEAHPKETAKVVVDCASGAHRGEECENARAAANAIRRDRRMETYRKSF